jgi:hypothetical protein
MSHSEVNPSGQNLVSFKGTFSPDYISLKMVWSNRPRWGHETLDFEIFLRLISIFDKPLKFLRDPHQLFPNSLFLRKLARVDTSQLIIPTYWILKLLDHWGSVFFLLFPCFLLFEPWSPSHIPIWVLCSSRWIGKQDWGEIRQSW